MVQSKLKDILLRQLDGLPPSSRVSFDQLELGRRIVLFFGLDERERMIYLHRARLNLQRYCPDAGSLETERAAQEQLEEDLPALERTAAFHGALAALLDGLEPGMKRCRMLVLSETLDASIAHYAARLAHYECKRIYSKLSARYALERAAREGDWARITEAFKAAMDTSRAATLLGFEEVLRRWSTEAKVHSFLASHFGYDEFRPKSLAEDYADIAIEESIKAEVDHVLLEHLLQPLTASQQRLVGFDEKWMKRRTDERTDPHEHRFGGTNEAGTVLVNAIEAAQSFNGVTAGLRRAFRPPCAGRAVPAAVQGSPLAQAGLGAAIQLKGTASTAGPQLPDAPSQAEHLCDSLLGTLVRRAIRARLKAWSSTPRSGTLASEIAKALGREQLAPGQSASASIAGIFEETKDLGSKALIVTKGLLDWHIEEVAAAAGNGKLSQSDIEQSISFCAVHAALLGEVQERYARQAGANR